jgi:hypothetical protein
MKTLHLSKYLAFISIAVFSVLIFTSSLSTRSVAANTDRAASLGYFEKMVPVLQHPRCLNCHPKGDYPLHGMDMKPHIMIVKRGQDNSGFVGMRCATCHGNSNNLNSKVPGAPGWALAPKSMAWVGKSKHEICLALKDRKKNGNMPLEVLPVHNGQNELVGWAWHPGPGRESAPGTQKEFGENTKLWVESGAACPD